MSYRCQECGKSTQPREKQNLVVTQVRKVNYSRGGKGFETVKASLMCGDCAKDYDGVTPTVVDKKYVVEPERKTEKPPEEDLTEEDFGVY